MVTSECVIVGGGPAGLSAAKELLEAGARVTIIDRNERLGGQLIKQTHMFFGSEKQYASHRGIDILEYLVNDLAPYGDRLEIRTGTTVAAIYQDKVLGCLKDEKYFKIKAESVIIATGASEKALPFENNDLPGVYAAGAVQTLMNEYGIKPGQKVLMVGSGNIGLIVGYQLLQAGIEVKALVEAADRIGGYLVHASKLRRLGVPVLPKTSIKRAIGEDAVEAAEIWSLDENWQGIPGTEKKLDVDTICIAVGLSPLTELLQQTGVRVEYVRELGGNVPLLDEGYRTTVDKVYACGDVANIEEASSAMVEGRITGIHAARDLGHEVENAGFRIKALQHELYDLRGGPPGEKVRQGIKKREVLA